MQSVENDQTINEIAIEDGSLIQRNPSYHTTLIDDELVCIDEQTGDYVGLNSTGEMIWSLLEEPLAFSSLVEALSDRFDEPPENLTHDIATFIAHLSSLQLIDIAPPGQLPNS